MYDITLYVDEWPSSATETDRGHDWQRSRTESSERYFTFIFCLGGEKGSTGSVVVG